MLKVVRTVKKSLSNASEEPLICPVCHIVLNRALSNNFEAPHGVEVKRGPSGHFFVQKSCDGEVFPGPFRRIPLGETTSTAPPRPAPRLTWGSRRVPQMPPHCMHSRLGTPPPDPADRILDPWQSRAPCIPVRILGAPGQAPRRCMR